MATGLQKNEEGVVPTSARVNVFPPLAYFNAVFMLCAPALALIALRGSNFFVALVGVGLIGGGVLAWFIGGLKHLGGVVEVHTEHLTLYRRKKLVWRCRWSDIESVESWLSQMTIHLKDGTIHTLTLQHLNVQARATLQSYVPRHLVRERLDRLTDRRMSPRLAKALFFAGLATGLIGLIGTIVARSMVFAGTSPRAFTLMLGFGAVFVVGTALALIGILNLPAPQGKASMPELGGMTKLSIHLNAGKNSPFRPLACVWIPHPSAAATRKAIDKLTRGFVVFAVGILLVSAFATLANTQLWPFAVMAAAFASLLFWSRKCVRDQLQPEGWKIITLEDEIEAIRDGRVYPLKVRKSLGEFEVSTSFQGRRRCFSPDDFMLQQEPET